MIQPGQTYRSADPRGGPLIRIERFTPGHNHAWVVNAHDGKRGRWVLIRNLHDSVFTKTRARRRTGYVLDAVEPFGRDEQAFIDLHAARVVPPVTAARDDACRPTETVNTGGLL
ncbi:hypothetical protein [Streptomyces zaomyceticus]|uniref:hypothetical protein n=1 Tax=Streptomyces zaomyceticus TaxID=68286 RepID=UPI00379D14DC